MTINTLFEQQYQNVPAVVFVHMRGTGAAAANLTGVKGNGVASIVRTGVGTHTVTLSRKYAGLLNVLGNIIDVTTPDDWEVNVLTDLTSGNAVGIEISKAGVAADLTTDEKLLLTLILQDTQGKPQNF